MSCTQPTDEQIEQAFHANLGEYFKCNGYKVGQQRYELHIKDYGGLFGSVTAATIKNVVIDGAIITAGDFENIGILWNEIISYSFNSKDKSGDFATGNSQILSCSILKSEIVSTPKLNNNFAKDLTAQLDKAGVTYQARIGSNSGTVISVNVADKPKLDEVQKNLVKALNPEKEEKKQSEAAPKQDKPKTTPKRAKH